MEISLIEETDNPLVDRTEIRFEVDHRNAPTPSRADVLKALSSELEISEDMIVIEKVATLQGRQMASGIARIYESEEVLEKLESGYLTQRTEKSKERVGEIEEEAEEKEEEEEETEEEAEAEEEVEESEEPEEEAKEEAESEEEIKEPEEETTEKTEEEETEEIDYQEISEMTISEIKEKSEELDMDYQKLLKAEKENKDRKTLKEWIERNIEE